MSPDAPRFSGCLYSAAPWSNLSGAPICALEHLLALRENFDEVRLVLCQSGPLEERACAAGVPVWCAPFEFRGLRRAGLRGWLRGCGAVVRSRWAYVRGLRRQLRDGPGILHVHSRAPHLPYALLAARWARTPAVVTIHEPWTGGVEALVDLLWTKILAARVVFLTQAMVRQHPRWFRAGRVVFNHHPPLPERPPPAGQPPLVALPARLGRAKGVDVFLEACRHLRDRGTPFRAWLVGEWNSAEERREAEGFVRARRLEPVVADRGSLADMEPFYGQLDVLLLPTRRDSFPRVVMEAMCRGIPVVASRVDGIPEMVADGETGFLVEPEDAAGFAAATARLLADPALRARMGAAARARARQLFSEEAYVAAMLDLYRGLPRPRRAAGEGGCA